MDFEKIAQLSIGLAAAIAVLWIVLIKSKRNGKKSGDIDPAQWKMDIALIVKTEVETVLKSRNEEIRKIFNEELDKRRVGRK